MLVRDGIEFVLYEDKPAVFDASVLELWIGYFNGSSNLLLLLHLKPKLVDEQGFLESFSALLKFLEQKVALLMNLLYLK